MWKTDISHSDRIGESHDDTFYCDDSRLLINSPCNSVPRISKIDVYHDGEKLHGFQVFYFEDVEVGHHIGSEVYKQTRCDSIHLDEDEYITKVIVLNDEIIDGIEFHTNKGKTAHFGDSGKGEYSKTEVEVPSGKRILSIKGGFNKYLDNLQFYFA